MESIDYVLKAVLDAHAGDVQLLALQLTASPASVERWISGHSKPRAAYEAKLRRIHSELSSKSEVRREKGAAYRLTPHHPMITEAVDQTLRSIREILHKRGHFSSRNQALDELSKLLFAHVEGMKTGIGGISRQVCPQFGQGVAVSLKNFADNLIHQNLPKSLAHSVDKQDFELRLKPQEDELALELVECFESLQRQTSSFSFSGFDILNEVFGKFLADSFIDEKELGQYLTPPEVVRFMVGLAVKAMSESEIATVCDPKRCSDFGLILDPSCGVASFLAEAVHALRELMEERTSDTEQREEWLRCMLRRVVVGIDKSERMIRLALTNIAMFGFPMARLYMTNSLARTGEDGKLTDALLGKAKLILTNPPFGACFHGNDLVKYKIARSWSTHLPGRLGSEILFVERYLDWLAPGGQLVAIVPDSVLNNVGVFEDLRRGISAEIELCSVVSLPTVTFGAAGTNTKTSILHLRKKEKSVCAARRAAFAICQDIGFTVVTKANHRTKVAQGEGDLPRILEEISSPSTKSATVRWFADAQHFDRWDAQHHASLSTEVQQRLARKGESDLCVSDVAELINEMADPRRWGTKQFNYIEISDIDPHRGIVYSNSIEASATPSRARKLVRSGDVLVSTVRPERGIVGVVSAHQDGSVCTTGLAVLRPTNIDPLSLTFLLKTDFVIAQLMRNNVGIAYPAIKESCLLDVLLPVRREQLLQLQRSAKEIMRAEERLYRMRKGFFGAIEDAGMAWRQMCLTATSKHRPKRGTRLYHRSRKPGSDSHESDAFSLGADRKA
jgi:type I restriction-modification system DNA methylase subunit